jgi:hypothetical protein
MRAPNGIVGNSTQSCDTRLRPDVAFDRSMVDFVLLWVPYGGPPVDEILPRFGILSYELPERIREIAQRELARNIDLDSRSSMIRALAAIERLTAKGHFTPAEPSQHLR